jgi:uncharacterized protein (TIGR03435 family)
MLKRAGKLRGEIDDAQVDLAGQSPGDLIQMAFRISEDQLSGPDWLDEARFDVLAKLPAGASRKDVPDMLRTMLAERFRLAVHREEKTVPFYALTLTNGPLGLKKSDGDSTDGSCDAGTVAGHHICSNMSMGDLAEFLSRAYRLNLPVPIPLAWGPDRPVFDSTGLAGRWTFTMDYGIALAFRRCQGRTSDRQRGQGPWFEPEAG